MPDAPNPTPQPPDQEAVNEHRDEGNGPFGSDMTHLRGGTRPPEAQDQHVGGAYSTGTEPTDGGSLTPGDARATYNRTTTPDGDAPDPTD